MTITDKIVAAYLDGMKARYSWARGEQGDIAQRRGLELGEKAARAACAGKIKLEGDAWAEAVKAAGFTGPITCKALAAFCAKGAPHA
jgi:hypothetical protein